MLPAKYSTYKLWDVQKGCCRPARILTRHATKLLKCQAACLDVMAAFPVSHACWRVQPQGFLQHGSAEGETVQI